MTIAAPREVLAFWKDEVGEARWYNSDAALDAKIAQRFRETWDAARHGTCDAWQETPEGALALLIVLDQFPRNMFRSHADAFASDAKARDVARHAIVRGFDQKIEKPIRQFFYLPLQHSEHVADQDWAIVLFVERMGRDDRTYPYALEHRAEIVRFGRFPSRNKALSRVSTPEELDFLGRKT